MIDMLLKTLLTRISERTFHQPKLLMGEAKGAQVLEGHEVHNMKVKE